MVSGDLVEQRSAGNGVLHAGRGHQHGEERPKVSVTMLRFLPTTFLSTIFLPASALWPVAGTLVKVLTL
ncbi:hypothetical protein FHS42_006057 [Streptomyces zagrosensis]|uniref:Uncharacterized protein n=1 Tax=Streptomyces zagrosensis TaxID=1042984 RepID=A0A7W9QEU5_9ACTN|nr:hypothetical protein [Streptomyces zagrosensis]